MLRAGRHRADQWRRLPTNFIDHTLLSATVSGFAPGIYDVQIVRAGRVIAILTDALTVTNGLALETLEPPSLPPGAPVRCLPKSMTKSSLSLCRARGGGCR